MTIYNITGTAKVATVVRNKTVGYITKGFNVVITATEETQHKVLIERLKNKTFKRDVKEVSISRVITSGKPNYKTN